MNTNLKKMLSLAALGMALLANTAPTWAGAIVLASDKVIIQPYIYKASGRLVGARYSSDGVQSIGCYITASPLVVCQARNADAYLGCYSSVPTMLEAVQRMTDSSWITFYADPNTKACASISILNGSQLLE